ncbi:MAG: class II glutamine amidotransferase, partial [Candidatus Micrarchaeota archaeon]
FMLIMQNYEKNKDMAKAIRDTLRVARQKATGLNFLLSDGKKFYAYRNYTKRARKYTLYYLVRDLDGVRNPIEHLSKKTNQKLCATGLHTGRTILFCSEKLTGEKWKRMRRGELVKVDKNLGVSIRKL